MNTSQLKQFAQNARRQLIELVSTKLSIVLDTNSSARRENEKAVKDLEKEISRTSKDQVIEKVAYLWFNRFCALRFMDVNRYTNIGVVSPAQGLSQPEILLEAKQGHIDEGLRIDKDRVFGLLNETITSPEPQQETYRILLVAVCNDYNGIMPFLFEKIADYTELLMPDDLLSDSSILTATREALSEEACSDVEVIGWLYQFYISEKKDDVFAGLKKNKKVTPENIPAATQLFTPNWIVRYLVKNSLGRLWMLNNPGSKLVERMEYYIQSEQEETDFMVIQSPEEIKICDPACGSGHMLVYAFEILYAIYEEQGYDTPQIPQLILENNLYGIEIDERAGELAAFALCMKAREKYRRFFRKNIQPNVCILENITFKDHEVKSYLDAVNPDLFTIELSTLLYQFKEADNFGSLIRPELTNISDVLRLIDEKKIADDMFLQDIHKRVMKVLKQADYLSSKYHVVIANPPYMWSNGMNGRLAKWTRQNYPDSKTDLFAMFIERSIELAEEKGLIALITMQNWMFITSYSSFRKKLFRSNRLVQMFHTGPGLFPDLGAFNVLTTNFIICKASILDFPSLFIKANSSPDWNEKVEALKDETSYNYVSINNLKAVPDFPLVYWLSTSALDNFNRLELIGDRCPPKQGLITGKNDRFIRFWYEVSCLKLGLNYCNSEEAKASGQKWFPLNKGGNYCKWYGNNESVVNWENDGNEIRNFKNSKGKVRSRPQNTQYYFREAIVYSSFGFENFGVRYFPPGAISNISGSSIFPEQNIELVLAFLSSNVAFFYLSAIAPSVNFEVGDVARLPLPDLSITDQTKVRKLSKENIELCMEDWDSNELSWDFKILPLLKFSNISLENTCNDYLKYHKIQRNCLRENEQAINELFISAYDLEKEVNSSVNDRDLSIKLKEPKKVLMEFLSYSVGCMFGRYSLDQKGLILANQKDTLKKFLTTIPEPTFKPDDDNVIPIMDVDWFPDDIVERFKKFLKITFGEEHYTENLEFIEKAIGKDIRKFFLKEFYTYHVKMYKKRPIYWLFSSPKGSFNALIYMHRYRPDTVSIVLNDYLREFRTKLTARKENLENISISTSASQGERTKALKEIEKIKKVLDEVDEYERDILYPLATKQIEIDLDDGVKVNYPKFGKALKKVTGLN